MSLLKKTLALIASLALVAGLFEAGLRMAGLGPSAAHSISAADYDRVPGTFAPGQELLHRELPALPHHVRINTLGFRGADAALEPSGPRVLCIGDSFVWGDYVDDDETLCAQIAQQLGGGVELLNGGVGGSTIVDQRVFLERLFVLDPDVVFLMYSENDLQDLLTDPPMHERLARNRALRAGPIGALYRLVRDTALLRVARTARANLRARAQAAALEGLPEGEAGAEQPGVERAAAELTDRYVAELVAMRRWLDDRGTPLVFAAFPWPEHVESGGSLPTLLRATAAEGIEAIDLRPALHASGLPPERLYLLPHDSHPSPEGYGIAARVIAPSIERAIRESRAASP